MVCSTANELTDKVLEQRRWFADPPENLKASSRFSSSLGLKYTVGTVFVGAFSLLFLENYIGPEYYKESILAFVLAVGTAFVYDTYQSFRAPKRGREADLKRMKYVPDEALSFSYGQRAKNKIDDEYSTLITQLYKEIFHSILINEVGHEVEKRYSSYIFDREAYGRGKNLLDHLKEHKDSLLPYPSVVSAYQKTFQIIKKVQKENKLI